MSAGIELRPVADPAVAPQSEGPESEGPVTDTEARRSYGRTAIVLAVALSLVVAGWVLSELQRGRQLRNLQAQIELLQGELAEKDRALAAHEQRMQDVRDQVRSLQDLLDTPLPGTP